MGIVVGKKCKVPLTTLRGGERNIEDENEGQDAAYRF